MATPSETDITTHVVLVTAFVQKGDKFLLSKRSSDDPQAGGLWSTPGGKVDLDKGTDIIENTIKREIEEEVGVKIADKIDYLGSDAFVRVSGHHVVGLTFLAHWKSGEAAPLEHQEDIAWYTLDELNTLPNMPSYLSTRIQMLTKFLS